MLPAAPAWRGKAAAASVGRSMTDGPASRHVRWFRRRSTRGVAGIAAAVLVVLVVVVGRPALHLARAAWGDRRDDLAPPAGTIDDFSRLERQAATVVPFARDPAAAERQLAGLLALARERHLHVAIAGARHSQGGHVVAAEGVVIDLRPLDGIEVDAERGVVRVQAGALWSRVIPELDRHGLAVEVMQSDADFSVGGSLSVDCHGWQPGRPPIAATVLSLRVMLADGTVVRCSRDERRDLFGLVLGGYGLVGVILEAELRVVPTASTASSAR